jgi:hypothetical protein
VDEEAGNGDGQAGTPLAFVGPRGHPVEGDRRADRRPHRLGEEVDGGAGQRREEEDGDDRAAARDQGQRGERRERDGERIGAVADPEEHERERKGRRGNGCVQHDVPACCHLRIERNDRLPGPNRPACG